MTDPENIETQTTQPALGFYARLSAGLLWLNERAWPLSILILVTAGLYLYQYIQEEKIPLSITSSAVLTALPAMSAILVWVVTILVAFVLMPIFVLFHRLDDTARRLSDDFHFGPGSPEQRSRHRRLMVRWGASLLSLGLFCGLLTVIGSQVSASVWWITAAVLGTILALASYCWIITLGVARPVSNDFRLACVGAAFVQIMVILNFTIVAIGIAGKYIESLWWLLPLMLLVVLALWMIQVLGALFLDRVRSHRQPVALLASAAVIIVIFFGLFPPSGAKLGGFALQFSASGARNCTIMNFMPESKGFDALLDSDTPGFSRPLRVVAEVDGIYFVRLRTSDSKALQFVPRASLIGLDVCPEKNKTASAAAPAAVSG